MNPQHRLLFDDELIVDLFAGGGGLSTACEQALGRSPDIAINHNDDALSMHRANHPQTRHFVADVFEVCPRGATQGRPVGYLHLSPDCTHHSQAAGGQPRDERIRALTWIGRRWAGQVRPRIITLENVRQILKWGPLVAKRDKVTGRVLKRCGTVAEPGEHVARRDQFLVPDPKREGITWRAFVRSLQAMGYVVEWRILCAADYGAGTTRERLFMVARCDGKPIVWPEPTHFKKPARGQKRWVSAAECIDWSIPCPSIFERAKPLAPATLRRIARGIQRFVLDSVDPFIVNMAHGGKLESVTDPVSTIATEKGGCRAVVTPSLVQVAHGEGKPGGVQRWGSGVRDALDPLGTATASGGGGYALMAASLVQTGYGEREGQAPRSLDITEPLGTIVGTGKHAAACAYLMQANGGFNETPGHDPRRPVSTITNSGSQQQAVAAHLAQLSPEHEAGALRVAAFLMQYYSEGGQWGGMRDPMNTVTTRDRLALVTVVLKGTPYLIVDIGLRMLTPRELYRAQGFPPDYQIEVGHDGRRFPKSAQVRMVGNSVSPHPAAALIAANCGDLRIEPLRRTA
jgi:DNA (cytosine-5)-methyltransferase 1